MRLEVEAVGRGNTIIHNYGHGGAGVTLSWGCAHDVVELRVDFDGLRPARAVLLLGYNDRGGGASDLSDQSSEERATPMDDQLQSRPLKRHGRLTIRSSVPALWIAMLGSLYGCTAAAPRPRRRKRKSRLWSAMPTRCKRSRPKTHGIKNSMQSGTVDRDAREKNAGVRRRNPIDRR